MDSNRTNTGWLVLHLLPTLQWDTWLLHEKRSPAGYDYLFSNGPGQDIHGFQNTEIGIGLRFAKEKSLHVSGISKLRTNPPAPNCCSRLPGLNWYIERATLDYKPSLGLTTSSVSKNWGNHRTTGSGCSVGRCTVFVFVQPAGNQYREAAYPVCSGNFRRPGWRIRVGRTASLFVEHNFGNPLIQTA